MKHSNLAMSSPFVLSPSASKQLGREVFCGEFVPQDFFVRQQVSGLFQNQHEIELDLGCGDGSFLIQLAQKYPERNFLGVERLLGRVRKVCKKIQRAQLTNVKILRLETLYTVEWLLPYQSFSRVHLICPDPWPKEKHHKHRLMTPRFFDAIAELLTDTGEFFFRTDHREYYDWAMERMEKYEGFQITPWNENDFFYPKSDFQQQWESQGLSLNNMRCQKTIPTKA